MIRNAFYDNIGIPINKKLFRMDRIKFNKYIFDNIFKPRMNFCELNGLVIDLSDEDKVIIEEFSTKKAKEKHNECFSGKDNKNRSKREMTGASIEYGILKFYGNEKYFDNGIVKNSFTKNHPDLLQFGILCDIKGSSVNNVPLVFKESRTYTCTVGSYKGKQYKCSNMIGVTNHTKVWLLGIASPKLLHECSDENLIINADNNTKTGFFGADKLTTLPKNWEEFKSLCIKESLIL